MPEGVTMPEMREMFPRDSRFRPGSYESDPVRRPDDSHAEDNKRQELSTWGVIHEESRHRQGVCSPKAV